MNQFYTRGALANVPPTDVAETIFQALSDPSPRFRYTCAWGGEELTQGRTRMSDDDWIGLGSASDDESYYKDFERLFGLDLRTES
jgi:hypothetical protein